MVGAANASSAGRVLQEAADVVARGLGQAAVGGGIAEDRLVAVPHRLVHVHARAVVAEQGLGHEGRGLAVRARHVLDHVLVLDQLVGHGDQRIELHVDLALAGSRDLVVVALDLDADPLHGQRHLGADVHERVRGRHREVALLGPDLVGEVRTLVLGHVPVALDRVDEVGAEVDVLAVAHVVEHEELGLGAEECARADAGGVEVLLGLARDAARVAAVVFLGHRVAHVADQDERLVRAERVDERGLLVRHQQHVRGVDLLEAADRGAVEAKALVDRVDVDRAGRERGVLPHPGQVGEAQVDHFDPLILDRLDHVVGGLASEHHG